MTTAVTLMGCGSSGGWSSDGTTAVLIFKNPRAFDARLAEDCGEFPKLRDAAFLMIGSCWLKEPPWKFWIIFEGMWYSALFASVMPESAAKSAAFRRPGTRRALPLRGVRESFFEESWSGDPMASWGLMIFGGSPDPFS